jgi:hypothetical protein
MPHIGSTNRNFPLSELPVLRQGMRRRSCAARKIDARSRKI